MLAPALALALPLASLIARLSLASLALEVEVLPRRLPARQGTKRRRTQVDVEDLVQAQILGEIEAIQAIEPVMGHGKRVKVSKK